MGGVSSSQSKSKSNASIQQGGVGGTTPSRRQRSQRDIYLDLETVHNQAVGELITTLTKNLQACRTPEQSELTQLFLLKEQLSNMIGAAETMVSDFLRDTGLARSEYPNTSKVAGSSHQVKLPIDEFLKRQRQQVVDYIHQAQQRNELSKNEQLDSDVDEGSTTCSFLTAQSEGGSFLSTASSLFASTVSTVTSQIDTSDGTNSNTGKQTR